MDISIITPFYKGNKYINILSNCIQKAVKHVPNYKVEWIIINDSPNNKIKISHRIANNLRLRIIANKKNEGIQKTRIHGYYKATGKYIIFLDQDDLIMPNALEVHLKNISDKGASISNGLVEKKNGELVSIFKNKEQMNYVNKFKYFFLIGNLIASPGMVMISKDLVPQMWLKNFLNTNGADDWLLWVSYLSNYNSFNTVFKQTYIHKKNAFNTSDDVKKMLCSSKEALNIFDLKTNKYSQYCDIYNRRLHMRQNIEIKKHNKIIEYLKNPDIAFSLFTFKLMRGQ